VPNARAFGTAFGVPVQETGTKGHHELVPLALFLVVPARTAAMPCDARWPGRARARPPARMATAALRGTRAECLATNFFYFFICMGGLSHGPPLQIHF